MHSKCSKWMSLANEANTSITLSSKTLYVDTNRDGRSCPSLEPQDLRLTLAM